MGSLKFYSYVKNEIDPGSYTAKVSQEVLANGKSETYKDELNFEVYKPLYEIDEKDIYEIYPQPNSTGFYVNQLPYIQFNSSVLPWLHSMGEGTDVPVPWMALFVFEGSDDILINTDTPENAFGKHDDNIFCMEHTDSSQASVRYIDIPGELFRNIAPDFRELQYLAHVKQVDMNKKTTGGDKVDYLSCVISNQYLTQNSSRVALLCLKGLEDLLTDINNKEEKLYNKKVRLPILKDWTVEVRQEQDDFEELINNIDYNVFGVEGDNAMIRKGFVPINHVDRNDNKLVSWYHGPLLGGSISDIVERGQDFDQYLIYDKESGMFDVSYSAAFQLGVSLAFGNQNMIRKLEKIRVDKKNEQMVRGRKKILRKHGIDTENSEKQIRDLLYELEVLRDEL
jgi:hypothetical protein